LSETNISQSSLIGLTAEIASAYVGNNSLAPSELPNLLTSIYAALSESETPGTPVVEIRVPAVSIRKSITDEFLICLEDGRPFKSLKRHLRTKYGLSPEDYRAKWGLPKDYPMVAPAYAATRSSLAKSMGLGQGGRSSNAVAKLVTKPAAKRGLPKTSAPAAKQIAETPLAL
jgi:predicted transcriptional regulator